MSSGLIRAVGVQALGAVFCAAVSFALLLLLGRVLGTAEFGRYVLMLNLGTLALVLIEAGWPTLLYRQGAQSGADSDEPMRLLGAALLHVMASTGALIVVVLGVFAADRQAMVLVLLCMACVAVMNLVSARMRATGAFGLEALWQSSGRLASAGLIVLLVSLPVAVEPGQIFAAWALGLAAVIVLWGRRWLSLPHARKLVAGYRRVLPFLLIGGLTAWLLKGDVVLLGSWRGGLVDAQALSIYAAGTRLTEAALLLFAPVGNVLLGRFSQLAVSADHIAGQQALRVLAVQTIGGAFVAGVLALLLVSPIASPLMALLFGRGFEAAGTLLPWVLAMLPFALANVVLVPLLAALGRERGLVVCMVGGGVVLLFGLPWLTAVWGLRGAAIALAAAHGVVLMLGAALVRQSWRENAKVRA